MVPLPLQVELVLGKIITTHDGLVVVSQYRLAHLERHIALLISQDRPSVLPGTRLQGRHSAYTATILEDKAIPFAVRCIHDGALSYSTEAGKLGLQDNLLLVWTIDMVCTIANLTTRMSLDKTRNHQEIILAIMLNHARTLQQTGLLGITLKKLALAAWHHISKVSIQLHDVARTIHHIYLVIIIEEERGIMEMAQTAVDGPLALSTIRRADISFSPRVVIGSKESIKLSSVIFQRGSPLSSAIHSSLLHIIFRRIREFGEDIVHHLPVYQVLGSHDRGTWHQMHRGAHHIEVVAHTNHVWIWHICPQHRVLEVLLKLPPV